MSRIAAFVLAANLLALTALTFIYPHLMAGPGPLIAGHQQLEADCFACHTPFGGASSERCAACHKPQDIGRLTTKGAPVVKQAGAVVTFHQKLTRQDCVACHSDHAGARRYRPEGRFSHSLLEPAVRDACTGCHKAPQDKTHMELASACTSCHTLTKWKAGRLGSRQVFRAGRQSPPALFHLPCAQQHERLDVLHLSRAYAGQNQAGAH